MQDITILCGGSPDLRKRENLWKLFGGDVTNILYFHIVISFVGLRSSIRSLFTFFKYQPHNVRFLCILEVELHLPTCLPTLSELAGSGHSPGQRPLETEARSRECLRNFRLICRGARRDFLSRSMCERY